MLNNEALTVIAGTMGDVKGWECITHTAKDLNHRLKTAVEQLWKERDDETDRGIDAGEIDHALLAEYEAAAGYINWLIERRQQ